MYSKVNKGKEMSVTLKFKKNAFSTKNILRKNVTRSSCELRNLCSLSSQCYETESFLFVFLLPCIAKSRSSVAACIAVMHLHYGLAVDRAVLVIRPWRCAVVSLDSIIQLRGTSQIAKTCGRAATTQRPVVSVLRQM